MADKFVIDTNVLISANSKKDTHVSLSCQLVCSEFLFNCKELHITIIDKIGLIMEEYAKHLNYSGQPGVGDVFFKYLNDNQYAMKQIHQVAIIPSDDPTIGFRELPTNQLDPSDRKFLATAVVSQATIVNATDSDWMQQNKLLENLGIELKQLCPNHSCK